MHFSLEMKYTYKVNKAGRKNYSNPYKDENDKDI